MQARKVAITGASSLLAEAILEKLPDSGLVPDSLVLLDDESQVGVRLAFADTYLKIQDVREYDYSDCALVLMLQYDCFVEEKLSNQDAILVSHALEDDDRPVYAANADATLDIPYSQQSIKLAGAELSCLLGVLPVLHRQFSVTHINSVLMRSAVLKGKAGIDELATQTVALLNSREEKPGVYRSRIAFNLLSEASYSFLNRDLVHLIGDDRIKCVHQIVDVPVFHGFSAALQLTFESEVDLVSCRSILNSIDNVRFESAADAKITDCNQSFGCVISQLEQVSNQANTVQFWMTNDPIRYGLANNYLNITDILLKSFL
jgi:aspartate-semialdehyde dehydrogenase